MSNIEGKVVIVTGANGAIGGTTAQLLAQAGARLCFTDLKQPDTLPDGAIFIATDISDEDQVAAMVDKVAQHFGRLDGAFNAAGIEQSGKPLGEVSADDWHRVMTINAAGMFFCVKHQLRHVVDGGSIVTTASSLGQTAIPNAIEYIASKHAVIGLTRAAAVEVAPRGTRVNAILPGAVNTDMFKRRFGSPEMAPIKAAIIGSHPMGRLAEADEFAGTVKWLLSDDSRFVTGATIGVDGGYLAV